MLWKLIKYKFNNDKYEIDKLFIEFEYNSLKIKHKLNFKNIQKFIDNGIYEIYEDGIDGNTFELIINKNTNSIDLSVQPYILSTCEGGKLAHEKFLEFINKDPKLRNLIKLGLHFNKYHTKSFYIKKNLLTYEYQKSSVSSTKNPIEYLEKEWYGEYAICCIDNNRIQSNLFSHIEQGINYGTNLTYGDIVNYNIIQHAIRKGKYELVRYIIKLYQLGKVKDMFRFENDLFCPGKSLPLIFFREDYGLLYFMFENGMTEDYFKHFA